MSANNCVPEKVTIKQVTVTTITGNKNTFQNFIITDQIINKV